VNPALRSSAAHVFVESLADPELHSDDAHHLFRVLRIKEGESVTVSDGRGGWQATEVVGQALRPVGEPTFEPTVPALTIASAIPKGDRAEWMVQKLTEIGAAEIVLLHCERSVVRWERDRAERPLARLRRVAREAAMQSRRVWLPTVSGPLPVSDVLARDGVVVAEPFGVPLEALGWVPTTVVIGPEGGFSDGELAIAPAKVALGPNVLRIETAALVAAVRFLT
jgi:16S rRNA (uracil1498-N3)-methyltransferase